MISLVSVVIVNWNGRHHLELCLAALAQQSYPPRETIVVDNGSTDGSQAWLAQHYAEVRVITNAHNRGFSAAMNQGIRAAQGEYIALLNNDTQPDQDWLAALVQVLELDARIGMAASLMLFADRPTVVNSAGVCVDRCGISWDRDGGKSVADIGQTSVDIFGASAGAALYRRALFDDIGLFDENLFIYLEDVDLAWRARWRGWRAVHVPQARIYHAHSATMQEGSPFKTFCLARNKLVLIAKNYPSPYLWRWLPLILAYDALSLINSLLRQRNLSALRGRLAGWVAVGRGWRNLRSHLQHASEPASAVFALLEPTDWPWRLQRTRYGHLDMPNPSRSAQTR